MVHNIWTINFIFYELSTLIFKDRETDQDIGIFLEDYVMWDTMWAITYKVWFFSYGLYLIYGLWIKYDGV